MQPGPFGEYAFSVLRNGARRERWRLDRAPVTANTCFHVDGCANGRADHLRSTLKL